MLEVDGGVREVLPGELLLADGRRQPFDECLWTTQASAARWLADTGLPVDACEALAAAAAATYLLWGRRPKCTMCAWHVWRGGFAFCPPAGTGSM